MGLFVSFHLTIAMASEDCPPTLKRADHLEESKQIKVDNMSLCEFYDEYQAQVNKLKTQFGEERPEVSFNPKRIIDSLAPRLIDFEKWESIKQSKYYSPVKVYKPEPTTWNNWVQGIDVIDVISQNNFSTNKINPVDLTFIRNLHAITLKDLNPRAGQFRQETEYGYNLDTPLKGKDILTMINKSVFPGSLYKDKPIIQWESTLCDKDLPEEIKARVHKEESEGKFQFHHDEWVKKQTAPLTNDSEECGVIVYPPHTELAQEMNLWVKALNKSIDRWNSSQDLEESPLLTIARTQRWFIALHPFMDGNGRPSRYIMDLLFQSIGLPAPILVDKDRDLYSTDEEWANALGDGLLKNLEIIKKCNKDIRYPGCQQIQ